MRRRKWVKPDPRKKPNFIELSEAEKVMRTFQGLPIPERKIPSEQGFWSYYEARWSATYSDPIGDIKYWMDLLYKKQGVTSVTVVAPRRGGKTWTMRNVSSRQSSAP